jgi:hypothetical protein
MYRSGVVKLEINFLDIILYEEFENDTVEDEKLNGNEQDFSVFLKYH